MKAITHLKNKLVNVLTSSTNRTNEPSTSASIIEEKCVTFDILAKKTMSSSIHQKFVLTFEGNEDVEAKRTCKVLKFPTNFSCDDVLAEISKLDSKCYPNLFMFVIEVENFGFCGNNQEFHYKIKNMQNHLLKFSETRPLILQITSVEEKVTKFYFKNESSSFLEIERPRGNDAAFNDFPSFLQQFLTTKITNFEGLMLQKLPVIKDSPTIIRFLRTLRMQKDFFAQLALKCASEGSKSDILAVIDAPFEGDGRILNSDAETWLKQTISLKRSSPQQNQEESEHSIFHTAIINKNAEIVDYLTSHCVHLIQQLPFEHQVKISTAAFVGKHIDVLCDLLEICDFPFPENFNAERTENEKLNSIIEDRREFIQAIAENEFKPENISKFIKDNPNLNIVYNFNNESALYQALTTGHYKAYCHLKSIGFQAVEFDDVDEILERDELREANKYAAQQRNLNVQASIMDSKLPILLLIARSSIHDRKTKSEKEAKCREKIRKWFEDIFNSKFGSLLLRTASMCDKLRIIFDFESDSVENVSLQSKYTAGSMYPGRKWIFIGAKLSDVNRDQQIKGVLAHELCHYVMKLIYENSEEPFYKHEKENERMFKEIVNSIDKWSESRVKDPDDECDEIISGVYRFYNSDDWIAELIVRVPQIFTHFDNDPEKIKSLEALYVRLFEYYERLVVPEMVKLNLEEREKVRKLNKTFGILPSNATLEYEFPTSRNTRYLVLNGTTVALTNIPKFLYAEIYKFVREEYGNLCDAQNIFVDSEKLRDEENLKSYSELIAKNEKINVIVDCTSHIEVDISKIVISKITNYSFIFTNRAQYEKMIERLKEIKINPSLSSKSYEWMDLSRDSRKMLLGTEINFQNAKHSLFDILWNKKAKPSAKEEEDISVEFSETADDQLLNTLVENREITVKTNLDHETMDKNFQIIFQERNFIKKRNYEIVAKIPQKDICSNTKKDTFVLLSDIAGTGKSWAMKKIAKNLRENNPTKWITYVDLKQFMKEFEGQQKKQLDFLNFMADRVFDFKTNFERNIFKKLYEKGKVCIIFDGFDEISPVYAETVKNLIQSFKQNGGNQLWIATRDYFEVDLQNILKLQFSYKFRDFDDEDGIDLIIRNCILNDLRVRKIAVADDFDKQVKNHPKYKIYEEAARKLHNKVSSWTLKSIGLPQLYKMIGDVLIEFEDSVEGLTEFTLYDKFIDHLFKRWYSEKGELREKVNIETQKHDLNYREVHEFCAMKSLFPKILYFCDLELDKENWNDEEIVGCGILNKKNSGEGDEFFFPHETFREFFAASFVIRILRKKPRQIDLDVLKYLIKFCSSNKYGVIQMFLEQGFKNLKALPKNKLVIVKTNVSKLLQINIYQYICKEYKSVEDAKNIVVIPDEPEDNKLCEDFGYDFKQNANLDAVVGPSKDFGNEFSKYIKQDSTLFVIIVPSTEQSENLCEVLQEFKFEPITMEIEYNWNDLTNESQKALLQSEVNIENHSRPSLFELLADELNSKEQENYSSEKINNELLNIVINKSQIQINKDLKYEMEETSYQILFQQRSFIKKEMIENQSTISPEYSKISQEQLLGDVHGKKYILVSDVAGTGKSISMQEITTILRQQNPKKWITYVDLKKFISEFSTFSYWLTQPDFYQPDFNTRSFMIESILKLDAQFGLQKYFTNLYKSGKVIIIFDGFDEIAPRYAELIVNLAESFETNGGNQLWMVTRDYYEVELMNKLQLNTVYNLDEFRKADGVNLMAKKWILKEQNVSKIKQRDEFNEYLKTSTKFENYHLTANQIVEKISMTKYFHTKLTCLLFGMIADDRYFMESTEISFLYKKIALDVCNRWGTRKGLLRAEAFSITAGKEFDFWRLHQYCAFKNIFPELVDSLFPNNRISEWQENEIIGCGLLDKKGENFTFLFEAFCDFFIADFVSQKLRSQNISEKHSSKSPKSKTALKDRPESDCIELLIQILTTEKFKVIRIFLNDSFFGNSILFKIQPDVQKFADAFCKMENFSELFTNDLENLSYFVVNVLQQGNYKNVKSLLFRNAHEIISNSRNEVQFVKFHDFLLDFLKPDDFKDLLIKQKLLHNVVKTKSNSNLLGYFTSNIEQKYGIVVDQET